MKEARKTNLKGISFGDMLQAIIVLHLRKAGVKITLAVVINAFDLVLEGDH